jgi:hypothetical protein
VVILTFLPASVVLTGIGVGLAVRLPRAPVVALVAPLASLGVVVLQPRRMPLQAAATISVYAALAALGALLPRP